MILTFATRPSALARWQTQWVIRALQRAWPGLECREEVISTQGDRVVDRPLPEIGGKGLFTQELEAELLSGRVQVAVHSLKDLPIENAPALTIAAIPARADARDALISSQGYTLETLPEGSVVGTSSLRRRAQLLAQRPDLVIRPLRGNVDTRVRKALNGDYAAIILAGAGVTRLGLEENITQWLPLEQMLPAPGQGALAVQCRAGDKDTLHLLGAIEDSATRQAVIAERAFLAHLGGGCSLPVAAYAITTGSRTELKALVASLDGKQVIHCHGRAADPQALGFECAQQALSQGADELISIHSQPT